MTLGDTAAAMNGRPSRSDGSGDAGAQVGAAVEVEVEDTSGDAIATDVRWPRLVAGALADLGVDTAARVGLSFVTETEIADLKVRHLDGHGEPTDVLSFPLDGWEILDASRSSDAGDEAQADRDVGRDVDRGVDPLPIGALPMDLGDIVVCPAVARRQAADHAGTIDDEVALLLVHSCCHLVGHDHADDDERSLMWATERRVLGARWGVTARDPWLAI